MGRVDIVAAARRHLREGSSPDMMIPELIQAAADAAGMPAEDVEAAIRCALDLLSKNPTRAERDEIYKTWLDPISRPLAESMDLPIEEVHRAIVASLQLADPTVK